MSRHDYLVLGMAAVFIVTNFLGAAFTINRVRARRGSLYVGGRACRQGGTGGVERRLVAAIQRVLEEAGVEFTNGDAPGLRLRKKKP